jgi:hypothetical protein
MGSSFVVWYSLRTLIANPDPGDFPDERRDSLRGRKLDLFQKNGRSSSPVGRIPERRCRRDGR